jgi:hypothetical protein
LVTPQDYLNYAQDLKLNSDSPDFIADILEPGAIKKMSKAEKKELVAQELKKSKRRPMLIMSISDCCWKAMLWILAI